MKEILHQHHIVPKHMGGTDDPSNLILLTIEEHAAAHDELYKKYGKIEDKLARDGLLGMVNKKDILLQLNGPCKNTKWYFNPMNPNERKMIRLGEKIPEGWELGRGKNTWAKNRDYTKVSQNHRDKVSKTLKKSWEEGKFDDRKIDPKKMEKTIKKLKKINTGSKREKRECNYCKKICGVNTYARFHGEKCKHKYHE